ncbi:MAG: DMT family transporter [Candidatus Thermoplasmatota archaeon]|nr:DMT family transporter [Candidatus Thermoplasmatota archaeon]MBS3789922.1 DMT family transporter [Candidatus Thermoplasmatota archaeon]
MKKEQSGMVFIIAAALLWGIGDLFAKIGVTALGPWPAIFFRSIFFLPIVMIYVFHKRDLDIVFDKNSFYPILAGVCVGLGIIFSRFALSVYEVSLVKPIQRLSILITVLLSILFLKEKMTVKKSLGIGLALTAFFLLYPINSALFDLSLKHFYLLGLIFTLGLSTVFLRMGILRKGADQTRFFRSLMQTIIIATAVIALYGLTNLAGSFSFQIAYPAINGLFGALAFISFCEGLKTVGASTAKPMMVLATITTVTLGVVLLNESLFISKMIGILLAILAVIVLSFKRA